MLTLYLTEKEQERDQEKWKRILCEIEKSLRGENYIAALQLVDKFLTECKSPDSSFQALMKKAQTCLDAWQDIRKLNSPVAFFLSSLLILFLFYNKDPRGLKYGSPFGLAAPWDSW